MAAKQGRKIAVVGGSGNIGTPTIGALLAKGVHTITAISREESTATFPEGVVVIKGSYEDEPFLLSALQGQDVLVLLLGIQAMPLQEAFIRAAAKAGVTWVLPTEFGSDITPSKLRAESSMLQAKHKYRDLSEELGLKWIAIVNNPWLDMTLPIGAWGVDFKRRTAKLYNGGNTKMITTTIEATGKGTAGVLSLPEAELAEYKNSALYLQSFRISQRDLLQSAFRITGTTETDWKIEVVDAAEAVKVANAEAAQGNHMAGLTAFFVNHLREGYGGDYGDKVGDMRKLGIGPEDLDRILKETIEKV